MTYAGFIQALRRLRDRPRPIFLEQEAIDFAVEWFEANADDVEGFLNESREFKSWAKQAHHPGGIS